MKIAFATDDKTNIAEHFGGSDFIIVATIEGGRIVNKEVREKPGHHTFSGKESHPQTDERGRHGFGAEAEQRHMAIFDIFKDCESLIVNMIGTGACKHFTSSGVRVIATDVKNIDEAIERYIDRRLNHLETHVD
ncbi:MAG TPA: NifB/NifX family molybdenum-iron cluster-binding protein [Desulfobacterales bacterium]|nr:NifB/NifX family molybdenum-iron cluster-binding protein [Desulfobacterales bacterium]